MFVTKTQPYFHLAGVPVADYESVDIKQREGSQKIQFLHSATIYFMREKVYVPQIGDLRIVKVNLQSPKVLRVGNPGNGPHEERVKEKAFIKQMYRQKLGWASHFNDWEDMCWVEDNEDISKYHFVDLSNQKDFTWLYFLGALATIAYIIYIQL